MTNKPCEVKAYCAICGELKVTNGRVVHPALDAVYADRLQNGFCTTYIDEHDK